MESFSRDGGTTETSFFGFTLIISLKKRNQVLNQRISIAMLRENSFRIGRLIAILCSLSCGLKRGKLAPNWERHNLRFICNSVLIRQFEEKKRICKYFSCQTFLFSPLCRLNFHLTSRKSLPFDRLSLILTSADGVKKE